MMQSPTIPEAIHSLITELLDCDSRPTFVADLQAFETATSLPIAYANSALEEDVLLYSAVCSIARSHSQDEQFWDWIASSPSADTNGNRRPGPFHYKGVYWTVTVLRNTWAIVGCNEQCRHEPESPPRPRNHRRDRSSSLFRTAQSISVTDLTSIADPDWTVPALMSEQEPFVHVIDSFDWTATPLGPMTEWPARLQQTFNEVLADSRPIAIYWGTELTTLYNEAFSKLCGAKHPGLLGKSVEDAWPDFCDKIKQTMKASEAKHRASAEDEWRFFVEKSDGSREETYLKWSISPIMSTDNGCLGFVQSVVDITSMCLWERRMKMLNDLGDALVTARDIKSYWRKCMETFAAYKPGYDVPLVILYSVEAGPLSDGIKKSSKSNRVCKLEGSLGVPKNHPLIPQTLAVKTSQDGLSFAFKQALKTQNPILLQTSDGTLPAELLGGIEWRGFGEPCSRAVVCPIRPTTEEHVMGLLVLGLNPRRPYDNGYQQCISLLCQKLTTTLASTILIQDQAQRTRDITEQAAHDEAKLQEQLAAQTKEATESTSKFQATAEFIPVGMCFGDANGNITFANEAWYRITGVPKTGAITPDIFLSRVVEEDQRNVHRAYREIRTKGHTTIEFRIHKDDEEPIVHPIGSSPGFEKAGLDLSADNPKERHVLASLKAERAADGSILRVLACLTDVTLHKEATEEALRRAQLVENYQKIAEFSMIGMCDMNLDGRLLGANKVFFTMCNLEHITNLEQNLVQPFQTSVMDVDLPVLHRTLEKLVAEGDTQTAELRFKNSWREKDSEGKDIVAPRWMHATFMPVRNSEGTIQTFTGCIIDTSLQKWQLDEEKKRAAMERNRYESERERFEAERQRKDEAIEAKRQQENFIDMTSHEMRNPLSAIVQCADAIIASLTKAKDLVKNPMTGGALPSRIAAEAIVLDPKQVDSKQGSYEGIKLVDVSIENAETIIACTQHQRRIVDDILTMSKMDSNLLSVTPTTVDPVRIAKEAFKMFEVEARRVDIKLDMDVDQRYKDLDIEFLDLDPSRLKQVLINLLTNALKFTKNQETRKVSIRMSASKERPTDATSSVQFIPRTLDLITPANSPAPVLARASAGSVYLIFEVKDTGEGLTEEAKSSLFQRFVQASPKTHVKYGGSGLGLFISKRLTEMQGGAIGVASHPGNGSTFAFYIEAAIPEESAMLEARAAAEAVELALQTPTSSTNEKFADGKVTSAKPWDDIKIEGVLIVEDNLINQQITRRGLLDKGHIVDVANHGLEALERLQHTDRADGSFPLTLITMDMEMPKMDGLTCTREIREMEKTGKLKGPRIPIVAVSANARTEQIMEAKAAGCDDVLVKPYRISELSEKMKTAVHQSRQKETPSGFKRVEVDAINAPK